MKLGIKLPPCQESDYFSSTIYNLALNWSLLKIGLCVILSNCELVFVIYIDKLEYILLKITTTKNNIKISRPSEFALGQ